MSAKLLLGVSLLLAAATSFARSDGQFNITINLLAAPLRSTTSPTLEAKDAAFCRTSPARAFGAMVTVVCATGEVVDITASARGIPGVPVHGGTYRFILPGSYAGGLPDLYEGYAGFGTVTTWRIVQLADRDYYELLMGW